MYLGHYQSPNTSQLRVGLIAYSPYLHVPTNGSGPHMYGYRTLDVITLWSPFVYFMYRHCDDSQYAMRGVTPCCDLLNPRVCVPRLDFGYWLLLSWGHLLLYWQYLQGGGRMT